MHTLLRAEPAYEQHVSRSRGIGVDPQESLIHTVVEGVAAVREPGKALADRIHHEVTAADDQVRLLEA